MPTPLRGLVPISLFALMLSGTARAQPRAGEFVHITAGIGVTYPFDFDSLSGSGFYAQGEYVLAFSSWFGIRPYAGIILASGKGYAEGVDYISRIKSNAFMMGGKARFAIPIPWVSPFLEGGMGISLGSFETVTLLKEQKANGLVVHVPMSLGLALGRNRNFECVFTYYFHPTVEQIVGGVAFGVSLPIRP